MKPSKKKTKKKKKPASPETGTPASPPPPPAAAADSPCSPAETLTLAAAAAASETESSSSSCEASSTSAFTASSSGTASTFSPFSSSASTASTGDERRDLAWLLDAFSSATIDQVDSAYREAAGDPFLAAGILGAAQHPPPPDPSPSPRDGSAGKKAARKPKKVVCAASGMVSDVIGKQYTRPAPSPPPPVTNAWKGKAGLSATNECKGGGAAATEGGDVGRNYSVEEAEQFLCAMLGENSDLGMGVVRDVLGVGSTIGAGVYVLVGTVAREHAGPALTLSFLIAGVAAALSAFCYAELASRCPSAGSAYHYSYICVGEGVAWLIGWALILEYTIGGSAVARGAVARGISPNLALFFGGPDSLPWILARHELPWIDVVVDPCAAFLVFVVTGLLCVGIKESSFVQGVVTVLNCFVMLFVIIAGSYIGFQTGWVGYKVAGGFFPYGMNGMLAGSATVFFAYIGFDSVASTAEEVKNPQRDLPLGIATALSICCSLYMLVSVVIVGLVPYFAMDPDTPISSAFARHGMHWAMYLVTSGAVLALCSTLMGSILPQPRILMAMARDGLLPSFFCDVNKKTQVPVKSTIVTGICAATLAFFMDVSQLAGMVSVGTLLAFTIVAVSILILRYVPPDEVPLPSSMQASFRLSQENDEEKVTGPLGDKDHGQGASEIHDVIEVESIKDPLIEKHLYASNLDEAKRRKTAACSIASVCVGVLVLTSSASATFLPFLVQCFICVLGGLLLLTGLGVLCWIDQDDGRHSFGHSGGFICPFVPLLPVMCILINTYLLINLGGRTWMRVGVWLVMGVFVYIFYGRTHSSLTDVVYVPVAQANEIYEHSSSSFVA